MSDDSETVRNNSRKRALKIIKIEEAELRRVIFGSCRPVAPRDGGIANFLSARNKQEAER